MDTTDFKYDVALSFLTVDEEIAKQFSDLFKKSTTSCFIYLEEQLKLAGTDGEIKLNRVFSQEAKIVVILYRTNWGKTRWTRIEETAIRNRGFDNGYDFVILLPLEKIGNPPVWFPKSRLWIDLEKLGIDEAVLIILERLKETSDVIKVEGAADKAARISKDIKEKQLRENILNSSEGLNLVLVELQYMVNEVEKSVKDIKNKAPDWHLIFRRNRHQGCDVLSFGYYLTFQFNQEYWNSLEKSYLFINLIKGYFDENGKPEGIILKDDSVELTRVQFDINEQNQKGWSLRDTRTNFFTTEQIVSYWINQLIDCASKGKTR